MVRPVLGRMKGNQCLMGAEFGTMESSGDWWWGRPHDNLKGPNTT